MFLLLHNLISICYLVKQGYLTGKEERGKESAHKEQRREHCGTRVWSGGAGGGFRQSTERRGIITSDNIFKTSKNSIKGKSSYYKSMGQR